MLYIVHITVANAQNEAWFRWMRDEHVPEVLATGCFSSATFVRDADADSASHTGYRIVYRAHSQQAFERYQRESGDALRADHTARFGAVTTAQRELLPVILHLAVTPPDDRDGEEQ